ncbi:MAG: DEAD/DEAH box helicase family protein [Pseudomonadota bacterium]
MKIKFDSSLAYQHDAIAAVVQTFAGQPLADSHFSVTLASTDIVGTQQTELGIGNQLVLDDERLLANVQQVQAANQLVQSDTLLGRHFSIEMETGTGKTYVYLRTIFELNKEYGFTKFIIVVPSVPIREGVLASIDLMKEHFTAIYNQPFSRVVYDSKALGQVRQFATSNAIQIMIMNIQSFQKDVKDDSEIASLTAEQLKKLNVINRETDQLSGRKPIEFVQATRPIVIVDEPQNMEAEASRRAIERLHPLCTLRYSATHKNPYNLLYKLDPIQAYDLRLVKRIEVASVRAEANLNGAFVELVAVDNKKALRAQLKLNVANGASAKQKTVWVKKGDDLSVVSKGRQEYQDGYIVQNISFNADSEHIEFSNGQAIELGKAAAGLDDEVMKAQVWETVEQHLIKERTVRGKGIKVLSLFFIDRVANYRVYEADGSTSLGKIGQWFEAALRELSAKPMYQGLINDPVDKLHNGYFSADKKGTLKDTSGGTKDDDNTYHLIMSDKQRLLSLDEPLRFIFSHSALREGWDNPNVFQICTLNESKSADRKRQEIGRGLRLPVNQNGDRVHDESVNRLTVIANESYEEFARKLQSEYEEDYGIRFGIVPREAFAGLITKAPDGTEQKLGQAESGELWQHLQAHGYLDREGRLQDAFNPANPQFQLDVPETLANLAPAIIDEMQRYVFQNRVVDARKKKTIAFRKNVALDPAFAELWKRISQRTRYRVKFNSEDLIKSAVARLQAQQEKFGKLTPLKIEIVKVELDHTLAGIGTDRVLDQRDRHVSTPASLPDILAYLQNETELTRHTLVEILLRSGRLDEFRLNPQAFITMAVAEINKALHDLMLHGIEYEKIAGQVWEMRQLETDAEKGLLRYLNNLYEVRNQSKTPYDFVEFQSEVERQFARDLDNNQRVKLFVKLPSWFKVDTPIGHYNPDWAIVLEGDEQLYLVRETKSTRDEEKRRQAENDKVSCGRKHFESIGVDFDDVTSLKEVLAGV